jgi:hypothetical protein
VNTSNRIATSLVAGATVNCCYDSAGNLVHTIAAPSACPASGPYQFVYDADFYPYGGERVVTNSCPQNYKFTGKERDGETQNDSFGARYY